MTTETTAPFVFRHIVTGPYQEQAWPFQWLAMCSCGRAIRCNSHQEAELFMAQLCTARFDVGGTS